MKGTLKRIKKWVVATLSVVIVCTLLVLETHAQESTRLKRVVIVYHSVSPAVMGVREGLTKLGYREGQTFSLEMITDKELDKLADPAGTFRKKSVNVIVAIGNTITARLRELVKDIPIVFAPASWPLESGFVNSLGHPGTNLTGVSYEPDSAAQGKQLEVFREVVPSLRHVFIVYDKRLSTQIRKYDFVLKQVAQHLNLTLTERAVFSNTEIRQTISSLKNDDTNGVFIICTHLFSGTDHGKHARQQKIPLFGCPTDIHALVSYAPDTEQLGQRGAWYVDQILKGAKPGNLPVDAPKKFVLKINLQSAKVMGLKIPPTLLQRADKVIE